MPSPAAACVLAATVFAAPEAPTTPAAALPIFLVVLVPAFLMITTLRFRSFKDINLGHRRSYVPLILMAAVIAAITANPPVVLLVLAYTYLMSAPLTALVARLRRRSRPGAEEARALARAARRRQRHGSLPFRAVARSLLRKTLAWSASLSDGYRARHIRVVTAWTLNPRDRLN